MEHELGVIFYNLNLLDGKKNGFVNTDNFFLLRKGENYDYVTFINTKGENSIGYTRQMFDSTKKQMIGIK